MWFIYGPAISLTDKDGTVPKQVNITMVLDLDYRKKNPEVSLKTVQSESNRQPQDYGGVKQKYLLSDAKTTTMYQLKRTNKYLFIGLSVPQLAIADPGLKDSECLTISKVFVSYTGADPAQNLTYAQDRVGGGLGAKPPEKFLGTTPFLSWETPIVP